MTMKRSIVAAGVAAGAGLVLAIAIVGGVATRPDTAVTPTVVPPPIITSLAPLPAASRSAPVVEPIPTPAIPPQRVVIISEDGLRPDVLVDELTPRHIALIARGHAWRATPTPSRRATRCPRTRRCSRASAPASTA